MAYQWSQQDKLKRNQKFICARVEWAGVGINLKTSTPSASQVRDAVKTILLSPAYRQNARKISEEIKRYNSPIIAVDLLEKLAATKQPVLSE